MNNFGIYHPSMDAALDRAKNARGPEEYLATCLEVFELHLALQEKTK